MFWVIVDYMVVKPLQLGWKIVQFMLQPLVALESKYITKCNDLNSRAFQQDLKVRYNISSMPLLFSGTFQQAINASKRELKPLFVYLHSNEHQDTDSFVTRVFNDPEFCSLIDLNFISWAASVNSIQGYAVCQTLKASSFPYLSVILRDESGKTHVLCQIQGTENHTHKEIQEKITQAKDQASAQLTFVRREREERLLNQRLRNEQDAAFRESLLNDQRKERKRREKLDTEKRIQQELEREIESKKIEKQTKRQRLRKMSESIPDEPSKEMENIVNIRVRHPNGSNFNRRFNRSDFIRHIYMFVVGEMAQQKLQRIQEKKQGNNDASPITSSSESEDDIENFLLCTNMPRQEFKDEEIAIGDTKMASNTLLFIQDLD